MFLAVIVKIPVHRLICGFVDAKGQADTWLPSLLRYKHLNLRKRKKNVATRWKEEISQKRVR